MPSVSIVMPLYNKGKEVKRSVESVLTQSFSDYELIVVNDGSTDNGPGIVRSINDSRIRIFDQENVGVSAARNRGINEASSDLISFLDADDEWMPSFLSTILDLKKQYPTCNVFATNYLYREVNGKYRLPIIRGIPPHPWDGVIDNYFEVATKSDPPLCSSAVTVAKDAIHYVGLFPVGVSSGEDLLTWARLAVHNDIAYSTKPQSIFCLRAPTTGIPTRIPAEDDIVGRELESLLNVVSSSNENFLKQYIGLWHRMRASMFLRLVKRQEAFWEVRKMSCYADKDFLFYVYTAMVYLPGRISNVIMKCLTLARSLSRFLLKKSDRDSTRIA